MPPKMIPAGYMARFVSKKPDWLRADAVEDIYSVTCTGEDFADYIQYWKHNGFWLFDSPQLIRSIAQEHSISLEKAHLFYYESYEFEFDEDNWQIFMLDPTISTKVILPSDKHLEGFDIVAFSNGTVPEHSPLSCNSMAEEVATNSHCLFSSFEEAQFNLENGSFKDCEPGPYRIFSVNSVSWT
jgi:hypothetical protein